MIKIESILEKDKNFILDRESILLLGINFVISSFVAITLCQINSTSKMIGTLLVLGILLMLHYCLNILRKINIRNESIKGLIKITGDIVKYGEFREKCKHLITNMKELIPYTICSIYTFDVDNDGITYPVAYDGPEGIGIGDLSIDLSSSAVTIKTIKEGKIYVSNEISKDKKVKFTGKFADAINVAIIVPVLIGEKVVGSILICGKKNLINFTANGIDDLLNILSNQMALAIENDGIYRDMKNKADIDPLTRLYNRRVLDREIENLISTNTQFSLVMYDIDDFKKVNDSFGHLAGDEVLKMVSDIVRKSIRKTDVACRYGGEEIIIIFKDLSKEDACVISERIRNNIEITSTLWSGGNIFVTVSGGVSAYPLDGKTKYDIIKIADYILYTQCKRMGKNKVRAYQVLEESAVSIDHI
jgi:diguanylate cyclase (GGDEF)-like protein